MIVFEYEVFNYNHPTISIEAPLSESRSAIILLCFGALLGLGTATGTPLSSALCFRSVGIAAVDRGDAEHGQAQLSQISEVSSLNDVAQVLFWITNGTATDKST